ncbi:MULTISPECIES: hypothetical protein [Methylorubrum]|uniref:hypothetical protein n=1 Tax=Methylorubrum TaxID=2282523 RepID=UPI0020A03BC2|nr:MULTISPECIES: hypothetical protein [Methylorubrum]MCP1551683.1 hypothetical protein [Methylorubrum zatmanii]MCP1556642.1 hypothetical protein [Methylorubrum extorquens]MCP1581731.1 hypothetical protein [Methylorubrum extorquens]
MSQMNRRQFAQGFAATPILLALPTLSAHDLYRIEAREAVAEMERRIEQGGDFDRELMRFEHKAQLLRERHNVFLWDGPTTARGYRHPSWPAL